MCDAMTMGMALVQAGGQYGQGRAAEINAGAQSDALQFQGRMAVEDAQAEAKRIRRASTEAQGAAVAAQSASGVKVGDVSALDVERQIAQDYTTDEYMAILTGQRQQRGAEINADQVRRAGRDARRASQVAASATLLGAGAGSSRASGWGSKGPGYSGLQIPAPIETVSPGVSGRRSAYWRS